VSVVCCQVEVSATSWSLVQRSLTDCVCDLETSRMRRPWPTLGRSATGGEVICSGISEYLTSSIFRVTELVWLDSDMMRSKVSVGYKDDLEVDGLMTATERGWGNMTVPSKGEGRLLEFPL